MRREEKLKHCYILCLILNSAVKKSSGIEEGPPVFREFKRRMEILTCGNSAGPLRSQSSAKQSGHQIWGGLK